MRDADGFGMWVVSTIRCCWWWLLFSYPCKCIWFYVISNIWMLEEYSGIYIKNGLYWMAGPGFMVKSLTLIDEFIAKIFNYDIFICVFGNYDLCIICWLFLIDFMLAEFFLILLFDINKIFCVFAHDRIIENCLLFSWKLWVKRHKHFLTIYRQYHVNMWICEFVNMWKSQKKLIMFYTLKAQKLW